MLINNKAACPFQPFLEGDEKVIGTTARGRSAQAVLAGDGAGFVLVFIPLLGYGARLFSMTSRQ
jgi:hypothetical protein